MTLSRPTAIGLYSIGIRGVDLDDLLVLAATHQIPFLHLRGGPRGFDLARRDTGTLSRWARHSRSSVPITAVTADLELADFLQQDELAHGQASAELHRLSRAAAVLGARTVRLLARRVLDKQKWADLDVPDLTGVYGVTTLVELHDPAWFTTQTVASVAAHLEHLPSLALLIDSGQIDNAHLRSDNPAGLAAAVDTLRPYTRAVHLSDSGEGLTGPGHRYVTQAFGHPSAADPNEIAFEWTGADRSMHGCLTRYHRAVAWWREETEGTQ
jgi:hypothetical protein